MLGLGWSHFVLSNRKEHLCEIFVVVFSAGPVFMALLFQSQNRHRMDNNKWQLK
jgi:hypothetical protein